VDILAILITLSARFREQAIRGYFVGTVMDATKAVVPDASVTAKSTQTGVKTSTQSNSLGDYRFN
jgi:hypothetical protein